VRIALASLMTSVLRARNRSSTMLKLNASSEKRFVAWCPEPTLCPWDVA
jgi:hypothetical protein